MNGFGGNDFIRGDSGNDTINGGDGFDTLSFEETFFDATALQGVTINVAQGTITDSWGFADSFTGVEQFEGSRFRDTFNGGAGNDLFMGMKGGDLIRGGGGFDEIMYYKDADFGGHARHHRRSLDRQDPRRLQHC